MDGNTTLYWKLKMYLIYTIIWIINHEDIHYMQQYIIGQDIYYRYMNMDITTWLGDTPIGQYQKHRKSQFNTNDLSKTPVKKVRI